MERTARSAQHQALIATAWSAALTKPYVAYDGPVVTRVEAIERGLKRYFTGTECPHGHLSEKIVSSRGCMQCLAEKNARLVKEGYFRKWIKKKNSETPGYSRRHDPDGAKANARRRARRADPEKKAKELQYERDLYQKNREEILRKSKIWREALGTEEIARRRRVQYVKHRAKVIERAYRRTEDRKLATPSWANLPAIREIYDSAKEGEHIDHIVPIKGKNVCGLHVHWNLTPLNASKNQSKGNKMPPTELQIDYSAPGWK